VVWTSPYFVGAVYGLLGMGNVFVEQNRRLQAHSVISYCSGLI